MLQRQPLVRAVPEHDHQRRNSPRVLSQRLLVHTRASACPALVLLLRSDSGRILEKREGNSTSENFLDTNRCQAHCAAVFSSFKYRFTGKPDSSENITLAQPTFERSAKPKLILCLFEMSQAKIKATPPTLTTPAQAAQRPPLPSPNHSQIKIMNARSCNPQHLFQ